MCISMRTIMTSSPTDVCRSPLQLLSLTVRNSASQEGFPMMWLAMMGIQPQTFFRHHRHILCTSIAVLAWCSTVPERSTVVRSTVVRWWLHLLNFYIRRHLTFPFKKWVDNANNMPVNIEKIKQRGRRRQAVEILWVTSLTVLLLSPLWLIHGHLKKMIKSCAHALDHMHGR